MAEFAHLHLHTEFSLLDGMGRIDQYVSRASELGIKHMAVTDHGVMYAAMDWYLAGTAAGLHPIIGMEAYLSEAPIAKRERKSYHLLLLAENEIGYRNLLKLASTASLEGFYYRPRIDIELLQRYSQGIIATSACLGGPVANNFLHGSPDKARMYAGQLAEIFGPDRFFIEIQDHGLKEQIQVNKDLIPLAKSLNLPLVATNDVHYCSEEDAPAQEVLICVQTNTTINDPKRLKSETNQLYFKGPEEMERLFGAYPESLSNTIRIAEMCNVDLSFKGYQLPVFEVPDGFDSKSYLRHLVNQGAMERYGTVDGVVGERIAYELGIIESMNFESYFLIVWDLIKFAKDRGIYVGPGRGSSAGSIVCYGLDITELDPLKYDLLFERFLNPARITMPDIDMDFADDRRSEVIEYVVRKYGDDRVAQIVTFGTLKAKAAVRDVGRAMGLSFGDTDRVARLIPTDPKMTIDLALEQVPELGKLLDSDSSVRELVDTARKVEGLARHSSTHAAGVVISRDPLIEHVPLQRAGGKSEGEVTTQFPMTQLEGIGLLKMDFLGLKTLTVLRKCIDMVNATGHNISLKDVSLEDEAAFALLQRGETHGVFQLEGGMTTRMTIDVAPTSFDDIVALSALIRPGPMQMAPEFIARKHGRMEVEYMHPLMEPILKPTQGVPLYQEQVMQLAAALAGFTMSEGDGLRKAMGKKIPADMVKYRQRFLDGCAENKIDKKIAVQVYDLIERFAGYGFPKAHSAAYGVITAQTANLKANYPVQFMAALMCSEIGNSDRTVVNVAECRRAKIQVLPPDINRSSPEFMVEETEEGSAIRFGLGAVKNVGFGAVDAMLEARAKQPDGQFASFEAFCSEVNWSSVSKRVVECLIKAGAMSCFGEQNALIASMDRLVSAAQQRQKAAARGQMDMFGGMDAPVSMPTETLLPDIPAATRSERLAWEKELLGLYLTAHPMMDLVGSGVPRGYVQTVDLLERNPGERIRLLGMIKTIRRITTKTNRTMAVLDVEDLTGNAEVVLFPDNYDRFASHLISDAILEFSAKVDERGESRQLIAEELSDDLPEAPKPVETPPQVVIQLSFSKDHTQDMDLLHRLDSVLKRHEGELEVVLQLQMGSVKTRMLSRNRRVEWSDLLASELTELIGSGAASVLEQGEAKAPISEPELIAAVA